MGWSWQDQTLLQWSRQWTASALEVSGMTYDRITSSLC